MTAERNSKKAGPAPVWRRFAAIIYDSFLVLAIALFMGFINLGIQMQIYGSEQLKSMTESGQSVGGPAFYMVLFLSIFSFFAFFWTRRGQTLGMQAWKICILSNEGNYITLQQSLIRWFVAIPSLLLGGLGIFWSLWDKQGCSWQDRFSNTRTLYIPSQK